MSQSSEQKPKVKCPLHTVFLDLVVFFLIFGWLMLFFSALSLFYTASITISLILAAALAIFLARKIKFELGRSKLFPVVFFISLFVSLASCYFATPTVFGGRDQGAISTAAISLSKNNSLKVFTPISNGLFQKYGAGRSLNFPGFDFAKSGQLISRFPVAYTSYLASAYGIFDLKGIQYANFIPLFLFLVSFWLILQEFFPKRVSFLGFLIAATFFPFLWFAKYTLTETYMLFLVWTGILFLIYFAKRKNEAFLWISLAAFGLSALTRIEGIIFFLLAIAYIFVLQKKKAVEMPKRFNRYMLIGSFFLIIACLYLNFPALTDSLKNLAKAFVSNSAKESTPSTNLYAYLIRIFFNYNAFTYLIIGLAGIIWLGKNIRKNWQKTELIPLLILFPAFFYLFTPQITLDDPWLLRRFVFAVFPVLIFYSVYILNKFFYHKIFLYIVLLMLILANTAVSWRFINFSENKDLLSQVEKISQKFGSDDLVLVDRLATGSGYSLASEPMRSIFGKKAVYFFNSEDLKYIDQQRYKNIYLITPPIEKDMWYAEIIKGKAPESIETISNNFLVPSEKKWALAEFAEAKIPVAIWKIK